VLVKQEALESNGVDVAFDAPTKEWVSRRNAPTIDLYLYDIREDLSRRETMWENIRDETGRVVERRPPPRWFRLSYLCTAWTQRPEDEHRLLSALLSCFVRNETMPQEMLKGSLEGSDLGVLLTAALPPTEDRSIADVWSAMGGELKPSVDLIVTAPLDVARPQPVAPAVEEEPILSVVQAEPASRGPAGSGTAKVGGAKGRKRRTAASSSPEPGSVRDTGLEPGEPGELVETRRVGTLRRPGRTLRIRGL
jgi:hypothetical protein